MYAELKRQDEVITQLMTDRYLVIGSNSFSGSHFVSRVLTEGAEVVGLSRSEEPNPVFLPYSWGADVERFAFHALDLNSQLDEILRVVSEFQPQYIVNFAAQGMVAQSWLMPEHWYQTNVVAQVKLHNELRKLSYLKKYVHVTTPEVYGSTEGWINEGQVFSPSTPYAVSRAACDMHLKSFFLAYKFPVVFTRAANVFGPGQQLYRIIPRTILSGRTGQKLPLHGGGYSVRSFIHISDVVDATFKIAKKGMPGETFHISTSKLISIRDLVGLVCQKIDVPFSELVNETDERLGKDQAYALDSSYLRENLAWSDTISLENGLNETIAWVDSNLETLKQQPIEYAHKI